MDPASLIKEFHRAFLVAKGHLHLLPVIDCELSSDGPMLHTNFVGSSRNPFGRKNIPRLNSFTWGQSCAKVTVEVESEEGCTPIFITIRKLNTRRNIYCKPPSFKAWVYKIDGITEYGPYFFIWCEKGADRIVENGIPTEIGYIYPSLLCINDFSFLAPFMDRSIAIELGWEVSGVCL